VAVARGALHPEPRGRSANCTVGDLALTRGGAFRGVLVDGQGAGAARVRVEIEGSAGVARATETDAAGGFAFAGLPGGVYRVSGAGVTAVVRAWPHHSAPPAARTVLQLVEGRPVVRGQSHRRYRFSSDAVLLGAIIAVGASIPWIIHEDGSDDPPGS
jgi:hypothetical protein